MSTLLWIALGLFVSAFVILFFYVKSEDKEEQSMSTILLTTAGLSFIITLILALLMLVPMFALFIAKRFVLFDTPIGSVVFIGGIVVVYALLFDHLLHMFIKKIVKQHPIHFLLFNWFRFFIFLGVCSFSSLPTRTSVLIAFTLTIIFFILDVLDDLFSKKRTTSQLNE